MASCDRRRPLLAWLLVGAASAAAEGRRPRGACARRPCRMNAGESTTPRRRRESTNVVKFSRVALVGVALGART
eukprot:6736224-Prymnesium_polylepis.1